MSGVNMQANPTQSHVGDAVVGLANAGLPAKTAAGRAEISSRSRGLNQRQRTVLLLVDGRRTSASIRHLAMQVGASEHCLDELADMGLITLPKLVSVASAVAVPMAAAALAESIEPAAPRTAPAPLATEAPFAIEVPLAIQAPSAMAPQIASLATALPTAAQAPIAPVAVSLTLVTKPAAAANPFTVHADPVPMSAWVRALDVPTAAAPAREDAEPARSEPPPTARSWPTRSAALPTIALTEFAPTHFILAAPPVITIDDSPPQTIEADAAAESARRLTSELFDEFVRANQPADEGPSTLGAPLRGGRLDSMMSSLYPLLESAFGALSRSPAAGATQDESLEEARRILLRELRSKAPVTGALSVVKLRRAATREDLLALLDEVGSHITVPMRRLSAQQTLLRVRGLLERPM